MGHLIAETNQSGQMLAEYIYLGDQLMAMIKPGESVYYYHNDHLGTPQVLTDDPGTIAWKAVYTPFGQAVASIQTVENPFRFPGQYYDAETGLHYNYFRYYDPTTGRYITPDPIGLEGGINLFAYVENNPLLSIDPFGDQNRIPFPSNPAVYNYSSIYSALYYYSLRSGLVDLEEGKRIEARAQSWIRTPYLSPGATRKGADCSGSTWAIYQEAGFPYKGFPYIGSWGIPTGPYFRPAPNNIPQPGDVGWFPGHVLIYAPGGPGGRDVLTAHHTGGPSYGYDFLQGWEKQKNTTVKWYRYYIYPSPY
jgi:RHS repeat-associated protein